MAAQNIGFFILAAIGIAAALLVILNKNPVASALSLVAVFFSFAGFYAMMSAHLVAALQILVYAGAILVLFVFVIMLLNADAPPLDLKDSSHVVKISAGIIGALLIAVFVGVFKSMPEIKPMGPFSVEAIVANGGNTKVLSRILFSDYILPFEVTSVLLLAAIIGSVSIAMRKRNQLKENREGGRSS